MRGRSAWNDGRETWLIDFPLLVLVVNRLRTPQAKRYHLRSSALTLAMFHHETSWIHVSMLVGACTLQRIRTFGGQIQYGRTKHSKAKQSEVG